MRDEINAARRKKRRRYNARRFFWFVVALVVLAAGVIVADSVTKTTILDIGDFGRALFIGGSYPAALSSDLPLQAERLSMAYAVVTPGELLCFSSRGGRLLDARHGMLNPCLKTGGNRIVLYDVGNRDVTVYNRSRLISAFQTEYAIMDGDIANDGTIVILTRSERYACQLDVYINGTYEKALTWYGASGYPLATAVRADGKRAAAVRVIDRDGMLYSVIAIVDLSAQKELCEFEVPELAADLYFEGDDLIAVTGKSALRVNLKGEIVGQYDFEMPLLSVVRDRGPIALAVGDNNRPDVNAIIVLDRALGEQCYIESSGIVKDMYISGNRLYVLGDRFISEYSLRGELLRRYEVGADARMVLELNGIIVIRPDSAVRVNVYIKEEEA